MECRSSDYNSWYQIPLKILKSREELLSFHVDKLALTYDNNLVRVEGDVLEPKDTLHGILLIIDPVGYDVIGGGANGTLPFHGVLLQVRE